MMIPTDDDGITLTANKYVIEIKKNYTKDGAAMTIMAMVMIIMMKK